MERFLDKLDRFLGILDGLGCLIIPIVIGLGMWAACEQDKEAEEVFKETSTFKVVDKDYVDLSKNMFSDKYSFVIYIERYDEDGSIVEGCTCFNKIAVSHYEYEKVFVDSVYDRDFINIFTYGN